MKLLLPAFSCLLLCVAAGCSRAQNDLPRFSDFPVTTNSGASLQQVDIESHANASSFRTRLRNHIGEPASFAGHYILVSLGCGTGCQMFALIDINNGKVSMDEEWVTSLGVCYHPDSRLLITNPFSETFSPWPDGPPEGFSTGYYLWNGHELELLAESREAVTEACEDFL